MDATTALAVKLATLVAPNYPCIEGTSISVLDTKECALKGTAEQRLLGNKVREVMGEIWALEVGAPARRLLEALCQSEESVALRGARESKKFNVSPTRKGRQLPNELVMRVLHFLLPDNNWPVDIEVASLGRLREVSTDMKRHMETLFPNTLRRYVAQIVRFLLHKLCIGNPKRLSTLAHASATLFSRCEELRVWMMGDEVDGLNNLLAVLGGLKKLFILVTSEDAFAGLDLAICPRLRCVHIEGVDLEEGATTYEEDRLNLIDTHVERPRNDLVLRFNEDRRNTIRPNLVRLEVARDRLNCEGFFHLLRGYQEVAMLHEMDTDHLRALGLNLPHGPSSLHFDTQVTSAELAFLALGNKLDLKKLTFDYTSFLNSTLDPAVFCLREGRSLKHLAIPSARLQSTNFGLHRNKHLRHLDLSGTLPGIEGGLAAALRQLGSQLAKNSTLQVLDLSLNDITDEAARLLQLRDNKGLKKLSLSENQISDAGLREALAGNSTLEVVDARGNSVTEDCEKELSSWAQILWEYGWPDEDQIWKEDEESCE